MHAKTYVRTVSFQFPERVTHNSRFFVIYRVCQMLCKLAFHFGNFWNSKCSLQNLSNRKLNFKYFLYALEFKNSKASPFFKKGHKKIKGTKKLQIAIFFAFCFDCARPAPRNSLFRMHLYTNCTSLHKFQKKCIQCNFKRFPTSLRCQNFL